MSTLVMSASEEQTYELGRELAGDILPGDLLGLSGDLGAGKTCLIQGICRGLGVPQHIYITSPTFIILNRYTGRIPIYHFDFYRLSTKSEIMDLGYEEYFFSDGVCLIEWAERAVGLLPEEYLKIEMYITSPTQRRIELIPCGEGYKRRFSHMNRDLTNKDKIEEKGNENY